MYKMMSKFMQGTGIRGPGNYRTRFMKLKGKKERKNPSTCTTNAPLISQRMRAWRMNHGLSSLAAAGIAEVQVEAWIRWEDGAAIPRHFLRNVSDALKTSGPQIENVVGRPLKRSRSRSGR